jgi:hypothetical protein
MRWQFIAIFVACVALLGCKRGNGPPPDLTNLVQPKGKVYLANGQPAKGAIVNFTPTTPDGVAAHGVVKSDGTFTFVTRGGQLGIVPGTYTVKASPSTEEGTPEEDLAFARKNVPEVNEQSVTVNAGDAEVVVKLPSGKAATVKPTPKAGPSPSDP